MRVEKNGRRDRNCTNVKSDLSDEAQFMEVLTYNRNLRLGQFTAYKHAFYIDNIAWTAYYNYITISTFMNDSR